MSRTTSSAVKEIIDVPTIAGVQKDLSPFIEVANDIVTDCCGDVDDYDDTKLELIERWLSAHFYAIFDPRAKREKAGSVGAEYQSKVELGFDVTHYGQMAMRVDTAGGLAGLNERIKNGKSSGASVVWLGKTQLEAQTE